MIATAATRFGGDLYAELAPIAEQTDDAGKGYHLLAFCDALGRMFEQVNELVRDTDAGIGWSSIFDVDRAPPYALPWLGQLVGVTVDVTLPVESQRQQIRDEEGLARGTLAAIQAAPKPYLTGNQTVIVIERDGSPYRTSVITYEDETLDEDAIRARLLAKKPAGIVLNYQVLPGQTWQQLLENHPTWQDVLDDYATWQDVRDDTP
jgi:hypothetical protein